MLPWVAVVLLLATISWILFDHLRNRHMMTVGIGNGHCTEPLRDPAIKVMESLIDGKVNEILTFRSNGTPAGLEPRRSSGSPQTDTQVVRNFLEKAAEVEKLVKKARH